MRTVIIYSVCLIFTVILSNDVFAQFGSDVIETSEGDLKISFLGHGSLLFEFNDRVIYADPSGSLKLDALPKADLVLITHEHGDHFRPTILEKLRKKDTVFLMNEACAKAFQGAQVMKYGDTRSDLGLRIEAVPAYNLVHKNEDGNFYHPKGRDNGYVVTFGNRWVYIAGDTENTPEMKALEKIDFAFLPMNLPYTMIPEMVADAAKAFTPKILYIYHYRGGDTEKLEALLKDLKSVELRIRKMY